MSWSAKRWKGWGTEVRGQRSEVRGQKSEGGDSGVEVAKELRLVPRVMVDPAQIQNVIVNLVLNARDAVGSTGRIRVETSRRDSWVVLAVADNGCGMSPEFV